MLSLGLGLSVLAAVGQIDGNLRSAISTVTCPASAPASFFFVDLQKDQMPGFLGRLENGSRPFPAGRPRPDDAWHTDPDQWRARVAKSPPITGSSKAIAASLTPTFMPDRTTHYRRRMVGRRAMTGSPQVSFAAEEAAEIGLKIGDQDYCQHPWP